MNDNRKDSRLGIKLDVELLTAEQECSTQTRDLSNGGIFLEKGEMTLPAEGEIVQLKIKQSLDGTEPPMVKARVVRVDNDGIALSFITDD